MYVALLGLAMLAGCLLAVQSSVNLRLNAAVKTPYGASTIQLGVAAALLAIVALLVGTIGALSIVPDVEPWHLLGGLASPLYITSGILLFPRLGALGAVGLFVTGQVFASLALDLFGLVGVPEKSLTIGIVLGAAAVLVGITVIIRGQKKVEKPAPAMADTGKSLGAMHKPAPATTHAWWIGLGVVAGASLPFQGAVNAQLRADLDAPVTAATVNFIVATIAIFVVLLVMMAAKRTPAPRLSALPTMPWWGWLGGACAASYVTVTFMLIPEIGAATTIALTVTGQQLASAIIDSKGWFRMPKRALTTPRLVGLGLLVAGSVLVQFS